MKITKVTIDNLDLPDADLIRPEIVQLESRSSTNVDFELMFNDTNKVKFSLDPADTNLSSIKSQLATVAKLNSITVEVKNNLIKSDEVQVSFVVRCLFCGSAKLNIAAVDN